MTGKIDSGGGQTNISNILDKCLNHLDKIKI